MPSDTGDLQMLEWFGALSGFEQTFYVIGIVMTGLFIVKAILLLLGVGADVDVDADIGVDADVDVDSGDGDGAMVHASSAADLHFVSVNGILAFLAVGPWFVVGTYSMWGSHVISILCGIASGFVAMYLVALMLRALKKLEQSGTINMKDAIGKIGEVYLTVPEMDKGRGKVNLVLGGQLQDYTAISRDSEPIAFGTKVRVVDIEDDDTLVVQRESEEIV